MKNGFTLIELLVVISIIAILSTIGIATYQGIQAKARDGVRKNDLIKLAAALEIYNQKYGRYILPADTNSSENCSTSFDTNDTNNFYNDIYINSLMDNNVPKDPSGTNYCYIAVNGGKSYRLFAKLENCTNTDSNSICSSEYEYPSLTYNYSLYSADLQLAPAP